MDFKKFTEDTLIIIQKLEEYGLSCLTKPIKCVDTTIEKYISTINNNEPRIYAQPRNWREIGALIECIGNNNEICSEWSFQLNKIHADNQIIFIDDIILGFIMLPNRNQNACTKEDIITANINLGGNIINTFQFIPFKFVPFKFVPALENTFHIYVSGKCCPITI